jgi:uncharacterized membrane protein
LIEFTVVRLAWLFSFHLNMIALLVIWCLGVSMIVLAALVYLPRPLLLAFCCILIFGHNLLDVIQLPGNLLWDILHQT